MNEFKPQATNPSDPVATLQTKIERLRQTIGDQEARLSRASKRTAVIGGILCLAVIGWFTYGYILLGMFLKPKQLAAYAETMLMDNLPENRRQVQRIVDERAERWAKTVSEHFLAGIPELGKYAQEALGDQVDEQLIEFGSISDQRFRTFVQQNRALLSEGFDALNDPEKKEPFAARLNEAIEKDLSGDIREQADGVLHTLFLLRHRLEQLHKGERLNPEQAVAREILMIARRMQTDAQAETAQPRTQPGAQANGGGSEPATSGEPTAKPEEGEKPAKEDDKPSDKREVSPKSETEKRDAEPEPGAEVKQTEGEP